MGERTEKKEEIKERDKQKGGRREEKKSSCVQYHRQALTITAPTVHKNVKILEFKHQLPDSPFLRYPPKDGKRAEIKATGYECCSWRKL